MKQDKKEIINNWIFAMIVVALGIGFLYALFILPSNSAKSSSSPEYKEWKQQTEVVKGNIVETVKRGKVQTLIVQTKQDKTTINAPEGNYKKGEAVKCRVYKKDGKLIRDLNKQKDINSASDYYDYTNDKMPSWKELIDVYRTIELH